MDKIVGSYNFHYVGADYFYVYYSGHQGSGGVDGAVDGTGGLQEFYKAFDEVLQMLFEETNGGPVVAIKQAAVDPIEAAEGVLTADVHIDPSMCAQSVTEALGHIVPNSVMALYGVKRSNNLSVGCEAGDFVSHWVLHPV